MSRRSLCLFCWALLAVVLWPSGASAQVVLKPNGQAAMPLRVKSLTANVSIDGQFAATRQTLLFQNETNQRIEADFLYTLPPNTLVTSFAYWYGDEKVPAKVVEKEEAAAIYQHITTRQHDPALVEMVGKNTFRARIFPVMPNADLKVEMTLVQTLSSDAAGVGFTMPLSIPGSGTMDHLDIQLTLHPDPAVTAVQNNYGLPITHDTDGYHLTLSESNTHPRKDLRVHLTRSPRPFHVAMCVTPIDAKHGYFALALTPDRPLKEVTVHIGKVHVSEVTALPEALLHSHHVITLVGRYAGQGLATVALNGEADGKREELVGQVQFGPQPLYAPLAEKLWAAAWMARLSDDPQNRSHVMALSYHAGIPSKYTSWLAVPKAEMARYEREIAQAKMEVLARRLATLILQDQQNTSLGKRLHRQLEALVGRSGWTTEDTLRVHLDPMVTAVATELANRIAAGQENSNQANRLQQRLNMLCLAVGYQPKQTLRESLFPQITDLQDQLLKLIADGGQNSVAYRHIKDRLQIISRLTGIPPDEAYASQVLSNRGAQFMNDLARDLIAEQHGPHPNVGRIQALRNEMNRVARWRDVAERGDQELNAAAHELLAEKHSLHPNADRIQALRSQMNRIARSVDATTSQYVDQAEAEWLRATMDVVHQRLVDEYRRDDPDKALIRRLNGWYKSMYLRSTNVDSIMRKQYAEAAVERIRLVVQIDKLQGRIEDANTHEDQNKMAVLTQQQAKLQTQLDVIQARMGERTPATFARYGDPLIRVEAPADAQQVVAVMPDGEVKPLEYNATTGCWEARFDIPTYATEGDYVITIIIVPQNGMRQTLVMHYQVDLTSPKAAGKVETVIDGQRTLRLELEGGEDVDRVKAVLPWGDMVELRPSSQAHRFFALVPLPVNRNSPTNDVTFIVTDRAHNRTNVIVEMSAER
jgi:hypothetical protein